MAPCLWWKGMTRLGRGSRRRRDYVVSRVLDKKIPATLVLRAGLRTLVVGLAPVRSRPCPYPHRSRTFRRSIYRVSDHPRQNGCGGITAPYGALACRGAVVCCGAPASHRDRPYRCGAQRLPAWCSAFFLRGRGGWLAQPHPDVLHPVTHPRHRWRLGGAGLQRLRPAGLAKRPFGPLGCPNLGSAVGPLAPAVLYHRGGRLERKL